MVATVIVVSARCRLPRLSHGAGAAPALGDERTAAASKANTEISIPWTFMRPPLVETWTDRQAGGYVSRKDDPMESWSVHGFDGDAEQVTGAPFRADVARLRRILLDLAAQSHDLHVHRAVVDLVVVKPRQVEELVARENAAGRAEQHHQQAELAVAERHRLACGAQQAPGVQVELPAIEAVGADAFGLALAHFGAPATKNGADAREQLARAEGLGEIVVGAELEAHHAVGLLGPARQHDDRDGGFVAQPAREPHAVLALKLEIEHNEIHDFRAEQRLHRVAVGDRADAQLVLPEIEIGRASCREKSVDL